MLLVINLLLAGQAWAAESSIPIILDPSMVYLLLLVGIYGIFIEMITPGWVAPGTIGVLALIAAIYGLLALPVNYLGLLLILLGVTLMVAETFLPAFGAMGITGVILFAAGSIFLLNTGYYVPWPLIATASLTNALLFFFVAGLALKARRKPVVTGLEGLIGKTGNALDDFNDHGWVLIDGEIWKVHTTCPIKKDQEVMVISAKKLTLLIQPLAKGETS